MERFAIFMLIALAGAGCSNGRSSFKANIPATAKPNCPATTQTEVASAPVIPSKPTWAPTWNPDGTPWSDASVSMRSDANGKRRVNGTNKDRQTDSPSIQQLWEWGYGFNNPNDQLIKQGKEPEPFSDEDEEEKDEE